MDRRLLSIAILFSLIAFLPFLSHAAERKPWPRRPGVLIVKTIGSERIAMEERSFAARSAGLSAMAYRSEEDLSEALMKTGRYEFVEPDYLMPAAQVPNDPDYPQQWFHDQVGMPQAWDISTGGSGVTVAVLDTGIDSSHPDLSANMQLPGYNVVSANTDTTPIAPHGTWVAGLVSAAGNNALGVSGVTWNVRILPVRITNNPDTTAWCSDMARGIEWAADQGAQIINLSYSTIGCPLSMEAASAYARSKGAMVFIASGNEGIDIGPFYPAVRSYLLVGGTDQQDQRSRFSNFGSVVDLMAPSSRMLTTHPGGGYVQRDGTSYAAPIAAGMAALIKAFHPSFGSDDIRQILFATARTGVGLDGQGRVDAAAALAAAQSWVNTGVWVQPPKLSVNEALADAPHATVSDVSTVRVYPNPWRSDRHRGKQMTFDQLAANTTIKIFTVSGHLVRTLPIATSQTTWDLTTDSGDLVATGLYLYSASGAQGSTRGKFAVIQ